MNKYFIRKIMEKAPMVLKDHREIAENILKTFHVEYITKITMHIVDETPTTYKIIINLIVNNNNITIPMEVSYDSNSMETC